MENNINIENNGIQCDHCDWVDETVSFEELHEWLGRPCPVCGKNLLTEEDYNNAVILNNVVNYINSLSEEELKKYNEEILNNEELMSHPTMQKLAEFKDKNVVLDVNTHKGITFENIREKTD